MRNLIIEDRPIKTLYENFMERTFPNETDDDDFDASDKTSFEDSNPKDTIFAASYSEEIDDSPSHSWQLESDYYVCKVPESEQRVNLTSGAQMDIYILFSISWDDNWSVYRRSIHCAAMSDSHESAKAILLKQYAVDNLNSSGSDGFRDFIEEILWEVLSDRFQVQVPKEGS